MTRMTRPDCAVMCNLINTHTHMTRMTGPDCVVMCNLINTHTHTHTRTGAEARVVAEMGTGTRITGTETRIGSGRAEKRRKSARNRKIVVDALRKRGRLGWKEEIM